MTPGYQNFTAWKKSMELVKAVYVLTSKFPKNEIYGLISQMQRCAVSIPSNIAEGYRRGSKPEFMRFLRIAYGSGGELETQLQIVGMLNFVSVKEAQGVTSLLDEVMKLLNTMIKNPKIS